MLSCDFRVDSKVLQHACSNTIALLKQTKKNMFRANVSMMKRDRFLGCERQHLFNTRRIWDIAQYLLVRACSNLLLHLPSHRFQIESHLPEHGHCRALSESDQSKE